MIKNIFEHKLKSVMILSVFGLSFCTFAESKMVLVKGGTFTMGSPATERQRNLDEKQHSVTISDFYCDAYEVQQADYEKIMKKNPSTFKGDKLPVQNVTYFDAIDYCNKKSKAEGLKECYKISGKDVTYDRSANGYRLLTEAEWEYACRAGTKSIFNTGNWNNFSQFLFLKIQKFLLHISVILEIRKVQPFIFQSR